MISQYFRSITVVVFLILCLNSAMAQEEMVEELMPPGLSVGVQAPDFTAATHEGTKVTLSEQYAKGPVVLIFYRGAWCPYCSLHLKSFQAKLQDFNALGATVLAVSVDKPEFGKQIVQKEGLGFQVISDPRADILEAYRVLYQVPEDLAKKYLNEYQLDLQAHSGRNDAVIAVPATYVISTGGTIVFAYANEDYKVRTQPEEILEVLRRK